MPRYDDKLKEEARTLFLQGLGYKTIATKLREQHEIKLSHTTISRWASKEMWQHVLDKQRSAIRSETNSTATRSINRHIKTLQAVQAKFISQLKEPQYEIRPAEMVNIIRLLLQLEGAKNVKDTLIEEVAEKLPEAMKKAKISKKQINRTIRYWVEMVKDFN
tara:strand:+ start:394 stop:879 length:486 start_codon:yes stop_codon:yes gene_type:complete